ncbi:hypothetical protein S7711_10113 [Stachybotrys chartarum IBT 7711]|uniref:MULE transposase domain-containing protein n=1 Tax=Stachybotrys chartarum (strain CBS 109288 / IBT 7711) TaxID=1280523 RepID=A0A084B1L8_STACB|nr:hypothetical protein S7711_10113 [Stachybotrys chartarum IBT 7711]
MSANLRASKQPHEGLLPITAASLRSNKRRCSNLHPQSGLSTCFNGNDGDTGSGLDNEVSTPELDFRTQSADTQLPNAAPQHSHQTSELISTLQLVRETVRINERLTTRALETFNNSYSSPPGSPSPSNRTPPHTTPQQAAEEDMPNPPVPGPLEATAEALYTRVNTFAKENGFAIVKRNGLSRKGRLIRYTFECDRYGEPRVNKNNAGLREKRSRKCGCRWKMVAESLEQNNYLWHLRLLKDPAHSRHNHLPSINPSAHPAHRKLNSAVRETIQSSSRRVGIRARDVHSIVKEKHTDTVLTRKDIYNARAAIGREKLGGLPTSAALLKQFDDRGIPYIAKWVKDEPDRLVGLVWTLPYCIRMWRRFPEVLSLDNTYSTNRFKLPLFQVTGQTCLGTVYNAVFGVIDNERVEGFQFLLDAIRDLAAQYDIRIPDVAITDFDEQMKAAISTTFPDTQQQLCIHHINSNVLLRAKQRWKHEVNTEESDSEGSSSCTQDQPSLSEEDRTAVKFSEARCNVFSEPIRHDYRGVLEMWRIVVFAETEKEHDKAWLMLCKEFDDQRAILLYLYRTYMPVRAQWVRCFIRGYRNFGIRVTSGTEASNNNIKSYLLNGMSHLFRLAEAIEEMMSDQETDFDDRCAQDGILTRSEYSKQSSSYLGELRTTMSAKGLTLITWQYRRALKGVPTKSNPRPEPIRDCDTNCLVPVELGIPCYHEIYAKLVSGKSFSRWEVHQRWHLREHTAGDPYQRILDPKIATAVRGRPKNTAQPVPARLAIGLSSQPPRPQGNQSDNQLPWTGGESFVRLPAEAVQARDSQLTPGTTLSRGITTLGSSRTTGTIMSGQRIQPSIRRQRSQWELLVDSNKELIPQFTKTVGLATKTPATCSRCHEIGHKRTSKIQVPQT